MGYALEPFNMRREKQVASPLSASPKTSSVFTDMRKTIRLEKVQKEGQKGKDFAQATKSASIEFIEFTVYPFIHHVTGCHF